MSWLESKLDCTMATPQTDPFSLPPYGTAKVSGGVKATVYFRDSVFDQIETRKREAEEQTNTTYSLSEFLNALLGGLLS